MSITLYQFRPAMGLPNPSPFCMKLETYLRMGGYEHTVQTLKGRADSSTGKAPYVRIDGKLITDSGLIIDHLERTNGHRVNGKLTLAQRAEATALQRMMEEHLYWVMVYARWLDVDAPEETNAYIRMILGLPAPVAVVAVPMVRRYMRKCLHAHGVGRHPPETIWQLGITDIAALGHWLGQRPYGFGDEPTVVDACMAAFVGGIVRQPWNNPLKAATAKYGNLVAHYERMMARYFPELAQQP